MSSAPTRFTLLHLHHREEHGHQGDPQRIVFAGHSDEAVRDAIASTIAILPNSSADH